MYWTQTMKNLSETLTMKTLDSKLRSLKCPPNRAMYLKVLAFNLKMCNVLGACPAGFNSELFCLSKSLSKWDLWRNYLTIGTYTALTGFLIVQFVQMTLSHETTYLYGLCLGIWICMIVGCGLFYGVLFKFDEMVKILEETMKTLLKFEEEHTENSFEMTKADEYVAIGLTFWAAIYSIFNATFFLVIYDLPIFPYYFLPEQYKSWIFVVLYGFVIWWIFTAEMFLSSGLALICLFTYRNMTSMANELKFGRNEYRSNNSARTPEVFVVVHTKFQILLKVLNEILRNILQLAYFLINRSVLITFCILIDNYRDMSPIVTSIFAICPILLASFWILALTMFTSFNKVVNGVTKSISLFTSNKYIDCMYMKKYQISCKHEQFQIGDCLKISKRSVPRFIMSLVRGIGKLLISS